MLGYNRTLVYPGKKASEVAKIAEETAEYRSLVHDFIRQGYHAEEAQRLAEERLGLS